MAVTQLLARIDSATAAAARVDHSVVHKIVFPAFPEGEAWEDFGWSPKYLELCLRVLDLHDLCDIVHQAFEGEALLNAACPWGEPSDPVYSEVRVNSAARVAQLAGGLECLPVKQMSEAVDAVRLLPETREVPDGLSEYVASHAKALQLFYREASRLGQAVVTWWD